LWALNIKLTDQESSICKVVAAEQLRMIFQLSKFSFDACINWHTVNLKRGGLPFFKFAYVQSISILCSFVYPCPFLAFLCFFKFFHSFDILVYSKTIWPVLKLPKIAWPRPFTVSIIPVYFPNVSCHWQYPKQSSTVPSPSFLTICWCKVDRLSDFERGYSGASYQDFHQEQTQWWRTGVLKRKSYIIWIILITVEEELRRSLIT